MAQPGKFVNWQRKHGLQNPELQTWGHLLNQADEWSRSKTRLQPPLPPGDRPEPAAPWSPATLLCIPLVQSQPLRVMWK